MLTASPYWETIVQPSEDIFKIGINFSYQYTVKTPFYDIFSKIIKDVSGSMLVNFS
jgi:hypothetical protein